jgi:hypothetical protein
MIVLNEHFENYVSKEKHAFVHAALTMTSLDRLRPKQFDHLIIHGRSDTCT